MREEVTARIVETVMWAFLAAFVLLIVVALLAVTWGVPRVVSCVDPETKSHTPAVSVEVTSNRRTPITQKSLPWGCTAFFYIPDNGD